MKTIGITGGTGFVGRNLAKLLVNRGYNVVVFTTRVARMARKPKMTYAHWDPVKGTLDINAIKEIDAVVHLGGAGIADKRWTTERKKEIVDSRVLGTRFLIAQLKEFAPNCKTLVAASATGYYGTDRDGSTPFTEDSVPSDDFLGNTCRLWEKESFAANASLRTVMLRLGIVLGRESGAFHEFEQPMKFGIVPILGSGKQMISWIEISDLARFFLYALEHTEISGIYNAVAPNPVTHSRLMKTIAGVKGGLKIPVPVPAFVLRILLGEMSQEVLKSCTVSAQKTLSSGFIFDHPDIDSAVKAILK